MKKTPKIARRRAYKEALRRTALADAPAELANCPEWNTLVLPTPPPYGATKDDLESYAVALNDAVDPFFSALMSRFVPILLTVPRGTPQDPVQVQLRDWLSAASRLCDAWRNPPPPPPPVPPKRPRKVPTSPARVVVAAFRQYERGEASPAIAGLIDLIRAEQARASNQIDTNF